MKNFNGLTNAQTERLAILSEELGEAQQAIGKIMRHGYQSENPHRPGITNNAFDLERELGDIRCAIEMMVAAGDIEDDAIEARAMEKHDKIRPYLHHQE